MGKTRQRLGAAAVALGLGLSLAACGSDSDTGSDNDAGGSGGSGDKTITLGIIPSWTDGTSTAYLWKNILEDKGYTVKIDEIADAAPLYTGLAKGDIDVYPSAWPEVTHASYMDKYGDDIDDLGTYYDGAKLTFAVPDYVKGINSIADLKDNADRFDGKIIGIEPGAGLTEVTKTSVMPKYGLDKDYTLVESSTQAMLTELSNAVDAKKDIVVTLWRPFWANSAYPVRDLEDPEGALGEAEGLHELARTGFADDFPEVAEMMANAKLDDEEYGSLESVVTQDNADDPAAGAQAWVDDHADWVAALTS